MHRPWRALATLCVLAGAPAAGPPRAQDPPAPVRTPAPDPAARVERFVLEWRGSAFPAPEHERPGARRAREDGALALVEWRRRDADEGPQLELELWYPADGLAVYATECLGAEGPRLVWRELAGGASRTLLAEWSRDGEGLRALSWDADGSLRTTSDTRKGAVMPLYLLELARRGRVHGGSWLVFDPLARGLERLRLVTRAEEAPEAGPDAPAPRARRYGPGALPDVERAAPARVVDLRRDDGTLAGRYRFVGTELRAFQWQSGAARARRVDAERFELLAARYGRPRHQQPAPLAGD